MLPAYITNKINRMNKKIDEAYALKAEIEKWAAKKGADVSGEEWEENVRDDCTSVSGIYPDGLDEYLESLKES